MVGVLMIMCEKRFLLQVIFERDTQGRREGHKQILLVVGDFQQAPYLLLHIKISRGRAL